MSRYFPTGDAAATHHHSLHTVKEPAPVVLSPEEAIARVLPWFLPEQEPRPMAVTFISNWDFWEVIDRLGGPAVIRGTYGMGLPTSRDYIQLEPGAPTVLLAVAEIEAAPPRQPAPGFSIAPSWDTWPLDPVGQRRSARRRLAYLFDAATGAALGSPGLGGEPLDAAILDALRSKGLEVVLRDTRTAMPTATAEPTIGKGTAWPTATAAATSRAVTGMSAHLCLPEDAGPVGELPPDAVPAPLADTTRWLPYVEGAWWTYEQNLGRSDALWVRGWMRESVQGRWRIAPDAMVVRTDRSYTLAVPADDDPGTGMPVSSDSDIDTRWLIVVPGGSFKVAGCEAPWFTLAERRAFLDTIGIGPTPEPSTRERELWFDWDFVLHSEATDERAWSPPDPGFRGTTGMFPDQAQPGTLAWNTPLGDFPGCRAYKVTSWLGGAVSVLCPEVGMLARTDTSAPERYFWTTKTESLTGYHVPRWRVIP